MQVAELARPGYVLIQVSGVLDGHTDESEALAGILSRPAEAINTDYVIDLSRTEYINSSMLGLLVRFLYTCKSAGRAFALLSPANAVDSVLRMTGLGELMPIIDSESDAEATLENSRAAAAESGVNFDRLVDEFEDIIEEDGGEEKAREHRQHGELRKLLGS